MGISKNPLLKNFSGTIEKLVVVRQYRYTDTTKNRTVLSVYPDMSNIVPSELQKKQRLTFKEVQTLALQILTDPQVKAYYKDLCQGKQRPHNVLISELLKKNIHSQSDDTKKDPVVTPIIIYRDK